MISEHFLCFLTCDTLIYDETQSRLAIHFQTNMASSPSNEVPKNNLSYKTAHSHMKCTYIIGLFHEIDYESLDRMVTRLSGHKIFFSKTLQV